MTRKRYSYEVVDGIPGTVEGWVTVKDLERYLNSRGDEEGVRLMSCQFVNGSYIIIWEIESVDYGGEVSPGGFGYSS